MACFPGLAAAEENSGIQYETDVPTVPSDKGSNIPSKNSGNSPDESDAEASGSNSPGGVGSGGGGNSDTGGTGTSQGNQAQGGNGGQSSGGSKPAGGDVSGALLHVLGRDSGLPESYEPQVGAKSSGVV